MNTDGHRSRCSVPQDLRRRRRFGGMSWRQRRSERSTMQLARWLGFGRVWPSKSNCYRVTCKSIALVSVAEPHVPGPRYLIHSITTSVLSPIINNASALMTSPTSGRRHGRCRWSDHVIIHRPTPASTSSECWPHRRLDTWHRDRRRILAATTTRKMPRARNGRHQNNMAPGLVINTDPSGSCQTFEAPRARSGPIRAISRKPQAWYVTVTNTPIRITRMLIILRNTIFRPRFVAKHLW